MILYSIGFLIGLFVPLFLLWLKKEEANLCKLIAISIISAIVCFLSIPFGIVITIGEFFDPSYRSRFRDFHSNCHTISFDKDD